MVFFTLEWALYISKLYINIRSRSLSMEPRLDKLKHCSNKINNVEKLLKKKWCYEYCCHDGVQLPQLCLSPIWWISKTIYPMMCQRLDLWLHRCRRWYNLSEDIEGDNSVHWLLAGCPPPLTVSRLSLLHWLLQSAGSHVHITPNVTLHFLGQLSLHMTSVKRIWWMVHKIFSPHTHRPLGN